jgi:hypothetical protein
LFGGDVSKEAMAKALKDGTCKFRTWRFCLDKFFKQQDNEDHLDEEAVAILKKNGYQLQSPTEMYNYYYSD